MRVYRVQCTYQHFTFRKQSYAYTNANTASETQTATGTSSKLLNTDNGIKKAHTAQNNSGNTKNENHSERVLFVASDLFCRWHIYLCGFIMPWDQWSCCCTLLTCSSCFTRFNRFNRSNRFARFIHSFIHLLAFVCIHRLPKFNIKMCLIWQTMCIRWIPFYLFYIFIFLFTAKWWFYVCVWCCRDYEQNQNENRFRLNLSKTKT